MAVELEGLALLLEVQGQKFENQLKRQNAVAYKIFKDLENRASNMEKSVGASLSGLGKRLAGVFAGIAVGSALNDIRKTADEYTKIINTLKTAGVSNANLGTTFEQLFTIAQKNAVPLETLAQLYGRVSQAQTTLKASSQEILQVTDIVAQSLRVSGASAESAQGALLQLAQAFSNGKVQAEEYNSLLDGAYPLLQAAAAGLKEAGGDVSKLTALVKDGKVSSEAFFRAIQAGAPLLQDKLAGAALTSEQAMTQLRNEFTKAVGEFDKATGASQALAGSINTLAGSIGGIGAAATGAVTGVQALINKVGELAQANAGAQRAQALTYQQELALRKGQALDMSLGNAGGRQAVANDADNAASTARRAATAGFRQAEIDYANQLKTTTLPPARPTGAGGNIKPVSLANFKVPGDDKGGGGGSSKEKLDAYDRELLQIEKRTKALDLEAQMVGKSTFESSKARAALELETAAKKAGIPVTDEMRTAIDRASTGYANAKVKVEEVTKAYEGVQEAQKFFGDAITDSLSDIIVDGEKAEDVIKNLAKALAKAAIQAALMGSGPLAGAFGTAGSNGNAGGLFGALFSAFKPGATSSSFAPKFGAGGAELFGPGFASGGYTGPGGKNQPAGLVHKGEVVWSQQNVRNAGGVAAVEALRKGYANGGPVGMSVPSIPRGMGGGGGGNIVVNNTQSDKVQATPKKQANGDITVMITAIEDRLADRMVRGQGSFSQAIGARQTNRQLRG